MDHNGTNGHTQRTSPFPMGWNTESSRPLMSDRAAEAIANALQMRQDWFAKLLDPRRNIEDECGYPPMDSTPAVDLFRQLFDREGIPNRVVQCMPKESWQAQPLVFEDDSSKTSTPFEAEWDALGQQLTPGGGMSWHQDEEGSPVWEYLLRGDIRSRIGRFGLILLGVDDGQGLETPLAGVVAAPLINRKVEPILAKCHDGSTKQVGVRLGRATLNGSPMEDDPLRQETEDALLDGRAFRRTNVWNVKEKRYDAVDGIPLSAEERAVVAGWVRERQISLNRAQGIDRSQERLAVLGDDVLPITNMADLSPVTNAPNKYDGPRGEDFRTDDGPPRQVGAARDSPSRPDSTSSLDPGVRFSSSSPDSDPGSRQERILDGRTFDTARDSDGKSPFADWNRPEDGSAELMGTESQYYGVHFGPSQFPAGREPSGKASVEGGWGTGNPGSSPNLGTQATGGSPTDGVPGQWQVAEDFSDPTVAGGQGKSSTQSISQRPRRRLTFLGVYDETLVQVVRWEWNIRNPRFRQPVMYRVTLTDPRDGATGVGLPYATVFVHWSRVIHLADVAANADCSDTFATPVMKPVLNCCLDIRKIRAAGGEGYWKSCFNGLSFETHPQLGGEVLIDKAALRDEAEKFQQSLDRTLISSGMEVKTIAPSVVDPTPHIAVNIEQICIQLGIPKRVFMGSERGELASSQDDASWNDRVNQRRHGYNTPRVIVPFIDRLIQCGVLPEPDGYSIEWPDLDSTSDSDKATIGGTRTTALAAYIAGGCDALVGPLDFLVEYQGMDEEKAAAVLRNTARVADEKEKAAEAEQAAVTAPEDSPFGIPQPGAPAPEPGAEEAPEPEIPEPPAPPVKLKQSERLVDPATGRDVGEQGRPEDQPFGIAANYSPDQLRDQRGRFAVGDEGGPAPIPPGGVVYRPGTKGVESGRYARVGVPPMAVPPPPAIGSLPNLSPRERQVEQNFKNAFEADPDGMAKKFRALVAAVTKPGDPPTFGTDDAKALTSAWSNPDLAERSVNRATLNLALHQTANAIAKRAFLQHLDTLKPGDEVLVTAGGCGAGKGFAINNVPEALALKGRSMAVWDSAGDQNATENPWVQQEAERRGLKVNYVYVHADPRNQWAHPERGVVKRASDPNDGRMVDAKVFADSYALGARNMKHFYEANRGNPSATFTFLSNHGGVAKLDGIPPEALHIDRHELAAFAQAVVVRSDAPPHVKAGATEGERVWAKP